ncbi:MAG: hypothetical protein ACMUIA_12485 [bacterium]
MEQRDSMGRHYEVIIIGAGPAGIRCAEQLKGSFSILLIEKNKIIGPKICAGGITQADRHLDLPENRTRDFTSLKILFRNKAYTVNLSRPLKTIGRRDLGQYQMEKLLTTGGITLLSHTRVLSIEKNRIQTTRGIFSFTYLIGADGSYSITRRHLGLRSRFHFGLYCNIPRITDEVVFSVNPHLFTFGYIWHFPHLEHTNIGIYFSPKYLSPQEAKSILREYLGHLGYQGLAGTFRGAAVNYDYQGCVFGHIYLIGDAAGLASKATGEGISQALISGEEVGKKIQDPHYKMPELQKVVLWKRRQEMALKVCECAPFLQGFLLMTFFKAIKRGWLLSHD